MKIVITLKDPDTMPDAVVDAFKALPAPEGVSAEEWDSIKEDRAEDVRGHIADKWMEWGEYLRVEFDTDAGTATVIPNDGHK